MRPTQRLTVAATAVLLLLSLRPAHGQEPSPTRAGHIVAGTVADNTGVLPGAEVRLVELGRATFTNDQGAFRFTSVPAGRVTIGVHLRGFGSLHRSITVPLAADLVLQLDPDLRFEEEVVVSAAPWAMLPLETAQQTDQVTARDVRQERVASVGEALSKVPGVAFISTGNALGTPVIRGVSENRIRVLNDGVPLNHQQFSWRHSPNVEPGFAERIELVRGPASILYGPDAMGGVVNLVPAPLPFAADGQTVFGGAITPGYSSNAAEWAAQARLEGALGGFGWRTDLVRRAAGDISTPRGTLENTDFEQTNANLAAGYTGGRGTVRARWNHWENETGFYRPVGFRLDLTDDLLAADTRIAAGPGVVDLAGSWQRNRRRAFEVPGRPATIDLRLETATLKGGLTHRDVGAWRGRVGLEYQAVDNSTLAGTLVPRYTSDTVAATLFEEARFLQASGGGLHRVVLSAGVRADRQSLEVERPTGRWKTTYQAVTASAGLVARPIETVAVAASVGRGWRPPTPFELYAFGPHGGVQAFQVGNADLAEETNLNGEVSLRYVGRLARGSVTVFRNAVQDYIYLADAGRKQGTLPVFAYSQADATLTGVEAGGAIVPWSWLTLSAMWSTVNTRNDETGRRLPQTPADWLLARIEVRRESVSRLRNAFAALDARFVGKGLVSGPDEPLGTPTNAYEVFDLQTGVSLPAGRLALDLALSVRNLFGREYRDFLWSYKPFAPNPGRDVRLTASWRF